VTSPERKRWVVFLVILIIEFAVHGQTPSADEDAFKQFLAWLSSRPPTARPTDLVPPYRQELIRHGLSEAEADRTLARVWQRAYKDPEGSRILWNKLYAAKDQPIFIPRPSALLMRTVDGLRPGKALDIGMGQGRNAVFLATQRWDVTGFDPSDEAIRIVKENAAKAGVKINAVVARDDQFDFGKDQWDLIVMTFVRTPTRTDTDKFWQALKPGGIVVYEDGADDDRTIPDAFARFRIRFFEDVKDKGDWNPEVVSRHQRLVAEKSR
jgi:2-polyprenyl-3-methyl-5-hydroxy-6-metoxy-1,4-benzoquinol methylase